MKIKNLTLLFILTFFLLIIPVSIFAATGYESLNDSTVFYLSLDVNYTDTNTANDTFNVWNYAIKNGALLSTDAKINTSLDFDGSNDYIALPNRGLNITKNNGYTISFWAQSDVSQTSGDYNIMYRWSDGTGVSNSYVYFSGYGTNLLRWSFGTSGTDINTLINYTFNLGTTWHYYSFVLNDSSNISTIMIDGNAVVNYTYSGNAINLTGRNLSFGNRWYGTPEAFDGNIDEILISNKPLTINEHKYLWNNGTPTWQQQPPFSDGIVVIPDFTFINQTPTDITNTNLFTTNGNLTIVYNIGKPNFTSSYLNYTINNSRNIFEILNGSVSKSGYFTQNGSLIVGNITSYSIQADNGVYPSVNLLPFTTLNSPHNYISLTGTNDFLKYALYNMSFENSQYLELDLRSNNSVCRVFYCNSSYTTGLLATNSNCFHFSTSTNTMTYNHTHGAYSGHNLFAFTLNSTGFIGSVKVTENGFFAVNKQSGSNCLVGVVPNVTRTDTTQLSLTGGVTFTNEVYTPDTHIHFFNTSYQDSFNYQACATNITNTSCSTFRSDNFEITNFPPIIEIINPNNQSINVTSRYYNITWIYTLTGATNVNFSVYLYNSGGLVKNLSLGQGNTSYYYWDIVNSNITQGTYYIRVSGTDNNNLSNFDDGETFYIYNDAELNLTAKYFFTNATISNFNVTAYDYDTGETTYYNATSYAELNLVKGHQYNLFIDHPTYSYISINFTTTTNLNNLTVYMNTTNSIYFLIYDSISLNLINTSTNIQLISDNETYNFITSNGTYLATNITPNFYIVIINNTNYATTSYSLTINPDTSQQLNAYLIPLNNTQFIQFYIKDLGTKPLENATINIQQLVNSSYISIGNRQTDITGFTYFYLEQAVQYKFTLTATGFQTRTFDMQVFTINNPYVFKLTPATGITFESIFNSVDYIVLPSNNNLTLGATDFSIQTSSTTGNILYTYINCNGVSQNQTGQPDGATAQVTLITNYGTQVYCNYSISVDGHDLFTLSNNYYVANEQNLINGTTSFIGSMQTFKTNYQGGFYTLLAMIIIIFLAAEAFNITQNPVVATITLFAGIGFFGLIGWISLTVSFAILTIVGLYYFLSSRGG